MTLKKTVLICTVLLVLFFTPSCENHKDIASGQIKGYVPADKALFDAIVSQDREFFEAYNNCDLAKQAEIYADDIEFFHDRGGLLTSKQAIIDATEANICGKVTRELIEGSIEVYPIHNYGAVQTGLHKFHNREEPGAKSEPSKFIVIWKKEGESWKMTKVVSLH